MKRIIPNWIKYMLYTSIVILLTILMYISAGCTPTNEIQDNIYIANLYTQNSTGGWQRVGYASFSANETDPIYSAIADTLVTKIGAQELENKTLTSSVGKGTWINSGIWTLPEFTLGGNIITNGKYIDAGNSYVYFTTTGSSKGAQFRSVNDDIDGASFILYHNSSSPAPGDFIARVTGWGNNSIGIIKAYVDEYFRISDATNNSENGEIDWYIIDDGVPNQAMYLTSDGTLYLDVGTSIFDDKDDAKILKNAISLGDKTELIDMKILVPKIDRDGKIVKDQYMMSQKDIIRLLAGAAYQNRDRIDVLELRIKALEAKVK